MTAIKVVADSACDLPPDVVKKFGISIVPLTIRFGEEEFVDGRDLTPTEFWSKLASSSKPPETAAPSPGAFQQAFDAAAEAGHDGVVCFNLSSAFSATYQSACTAAEAVADRFPVRVVDTRTVTLGEGMIALAAARMAEEGKGLDEVARASEQIALHTRTYGALDNLEALRRGGRIGGAKALLGSLLSVKPIIEVRDGVVEAESRQRTRARSLQYLVDKVHQHGEIENLAVLHGDAPDLDHFLEMLGNVFPREEVVVGSIGPVIGTHVGPGTMGVSFQLATH